MKLLTFVLVLVTTARGHAQELMSDNDTQVLRVVLEAMEIPAVVPTGINLGNKAVVISDVTKANCPSTNRNSGA